MAKASLIVWLRLMCSLGLGCAVLCGVASVGSALQSHHLSMVQEPVEDGAGGSGVPMQYLRVRQRPTLTPGQVVGHWQTLHSGPTHHRWTQI